MSLGGMIKGDQLLAKKTQKGKGNRDGSPIKITINESLWTTSYNSTAQIAVAHLCVNRNIFVVNWVRAGNAMLFMVMLLTIMIGSRIELTLCLGIESPSSHTLLILLLLLHNNSFNSMIKAGHWRRSKAEVVRVSPATAQSQFINVAPPPSLLLSVSCMHSIKMHSYGNVKI